MAAPVAEKVAAGIDEAMGRCILTLYRSAAQPAVARRGADLERAAVRPGLALLATDDHMVGTEPQRRRAAARAGARTEVLHDLGHWWMTQDPEPRGGGAHPVLGLAVTAHHTRYGRNFPFSVITARSPFGSSTRRKSSSKSMAETIPSPNSSRASSEIVAP